VQSHAESHCRRHRAHGSDDADLGTLRLRRGACGSDLRYEKSSRCTGVKSILSTDHTGAGDNVINGSFFMIRLPEPKERAAEKTGDRFPVCHIHLHKFDAASGLAKGALQVLSALAVVVGNDGRGAGLLGEGRHNCFAKARYSAGDKQRLAMQLICLVLRRSFEIDGESSLECPDLVHGLCVVWSGGDCHGWK
jgi:hypothetical protein